MIDGKHSYCDHRYGFDWGPVSVQRVCDGKNFVYLQIMSKNRTVDIKVLMGGKIEVGEVVKIYRGNK